MHGSTLFLYRAIGHPWILVSSRGPGTNPPWILRDNLSFAEAKSYRQIFNCIEGLCPQPLCIAKMLYIFVI